MHGRDSRRLLKRCPLHRRDLAVELLKEEMQRRQARQLIENIAKCNYKALPKASGRSNRLRGSGLIGLDRMTTIEAKLDAVMNKLGNNEKRMHTTHEVGAIKEGHVEEEPYQVEEA